MITDHMVILNEDEAGLVADLLAMTAAVLGVGLSRHQRAVLRIVPELERSHDLMVQIASRSNHILGEDLSPRARGIVERMGNLASEMWRHAVDSWYQRDRSAAPALEARDDEMDELHASLIAELASGRMALPVTMEMTLVARFYERLGDHAVYLAGTTKDSPAAD